MLKRINDLLNQNKTFAIETTLSSKTLANTIKTAKSFNYNVILLYFWLNSVGLAIQRIKERVRKGGHSISDDIVERRYYRGLKNLFDVFLPLVDKFIIFDNSGNKAIKISETDVKGKQIIYNFEKMNELMRIVNDGKHQKG